MAEGPVQGLYWLAALDIIRADKELKVMVVCSSNKSEGKTTSVIYLGTTMAQDLATMGQQVEVLKATIAQLKEKLAFARDYADEIGRTAPLTICMGDAVMAGVAMLPRKRVRTSWMRS